MKIKFNSDDDLPLKKTLELYDILLVVQLFSLLVLFQHEF